jgi:hypothetical protein
VDLEVGEYMIAMLLCTTWTHNDRVITHTSGCPWRYVEIREDSAYMYCSTDHHIADLNSASLAGSMCGDRHDSSRLAS